MGDLINAYAPLLANPPSTWQLVTDTTNFVATGAFNQFWVFDWNEIWHPHVLVCCMALTLGGVLCAAAGIGGGGIIVTVLMVAGALTPYDAVPLSKAVVMVGALMQLTLNLGKKLSAQQSDSNAPDLIDWNIVRLIVPMALTGTLVGVLLNYGTPGWEIVGMLSVVLMCMTGMVTHKGLEQRAQEKVSEAESESTRLLPAGPPGNVTPPVTAPQGGDVEGGSEAAAESDAKSGWDKLNYVMLGILLFIVVVCGVVRHHMGFCLEEIEEGQITVQREGGGPSPGVEAACRHPVLEILFGDSMERWMKNKGTAMGFMTAVLFVPMAICVSIGFYFASDLISNHGWTWKQTLLYQVMALVTGMLAGLVGIGGGLIFSPFMLMAGIEPSVAVATSSTCVIFTSSSTTMQYLLIDRIRMALAVVYGIVNCTASYFGTKAVHYVQDRYSGQRSLITFIVAAAVGASAVLAVIKGIQEFETDLKTPING